MRCPFCGETDTQVKDSRPTEDQVSIRRRRICAACNSRFTTYERVQLCELTVLKKNGRKRPFDREKLTRSIETAVRKRSIDDIKLNRVINGIVRQLESCGDSEIKSTYIGEVVMENLKNLDLVSYIRFASVYCDFRNPKDFEGFIDLLHKQKLAS